MTDKHIPASKLLALINEYDDSVHDLPQAIRALIEEAPEVEAPPSTDLTKLVGELVQALDRYSGCFARLSYARLSDEINTLVTRAKEYLK